MLRCKISLITFQFKHFPYRQTKGSCGVAATRLARDLRETPGVEAANKTTAVSVSLMRENCSPLVDRISILYLTFCLYPVAWNAFTF